MIRFIYVVRFYKLHKTALFMQEVDKIDSKFLLELCTSCLIFFIFLKKLCITNNCQLTEGDCERDIIIVYFYNK